MRKTDGKHLEMYLTSFIHREGLFSIAERWFCGRAEPDDAVRLTEILICDGFVIAETVKAVARSLMEALDRKPFFEERIHDKGQLRDALCRSLLDKDPRAEELFTLYKKNPDFYYREAPINGVMCLDETAHLLGLYRIKRPRRIAEKANRRIARWIFHSVLKRAQSMAEERAQRSGIPIDQLVTPENEMIREFIEAEESIALSFSEGAIEFDRAAMTIRDVGGIKIIADDWKLSHLERLLDESSTIRVIDKESFLGHYQAKSLILDVLWDADHVCRRYHDTRSWEKYLNRGIPEERLKAGLEPFLTDCGPNVTIELMLTTFPNMVESELGNSIHEERIRAQRDNKEYKGYIPMNVEFLVEYLFAVGFSPVIHVDKVPLKLWGRYLPDTLSSYIRRLYSLPEYDLLH
jgi:hypothetical protein